MTGAPSFPLCRIIYPALSGDQGSTIDLCLTLFPWALFLSAKPAVKLQDVNVLDVLQPEPGAFYIMDRACLAFERLFTLHAAGSLFIIRAKSNTRYRRLYSRPAEKSGGVPNNFALPARTAADLYRRRWQVELFFKWIKQRLRIKTFFGTSENAVKSRIWIAIPVYVLVAIIRKRLNVDADLYRILQILSLTLFEKTQLFQLLAESPRTLGDAQLSNQLNLFNDFTGQ